MTLINGRKGSRCLGFRGLAVAAAVVAGGSSWAAGAPFLATDFTGFTLPAGDGPHQTVVADIDGDGAKDLLVINAFDSSVWIYRNIGGTNALSAASFDQAVKIPTVFGGNNSAHLAVADVTGDGKPELVVPNPASDTVSVFKNQSVSGVVSTNSFAGKVDFSVGGLPVHVAVADLTGDGKPEILTANYSSGTVTVLKNAMESG